MHYDSKGKITSPFKHSKHHDHPTEELERLTFKGLNLTVAFNNKILSKLESNHKKQLVVVKIKKSSNISMEISGGKKVNFDFKVESFYLKVRALDLHWFIFFEHYYQKKQ
jgi:hypothetical protein